MFMELHNWFMAVIMGFVWCMVLHSWFMKLNKYSMGLNDIVMDFQNYVAT